MNNYINELISSIKQADKVSISVGLILLIFYPKIRRFLEKIIETIFLKSSIEESIKVFIRSIINISANVLLILIILKQFGIQLSSISSILAGLSIFLGFAFK